MRRDDCESVNDDLKAYLDHELGPMRHRDVARHLAGCTKCQQEVRKMSLITEEIAPKEDLDDLEKRRLVEAMASAVDRRSVRTRRPRRALVVIGAGAALLLGAVFLFPLFATIHEKAANDSDSSAKFADAPPMPVGQGVIGLPSHANSAPVPENAPGQLGNQVKGPSDNSSDEALLRQVHKSATITVQVNDPEAVGDQIEEIAKTAGGYVSTSNMTTNADGTKSCELNVEVPMPQFEATLKDIARFGVVQDKQVSAEDITDQVSDADQREAVLESDMNEALDQLKKKGSHASWDLQEDARDLRIQLAQSRARLRILRGMAELSEIDVTLAQPTEPAPAVQTGFVSNISSSASGSLQAASNALATLIALLLWILAYSPLWLPAVLVGRWIWKRYFGAVPGSGEA